MFSLYRGLYSHMCLLSVLAYTYNNENVIKLTSKIEGKKKTFETPFLFYTKWKKKIENVF